MKRIIFALALLVCLCAPSALAAFNGADITELTQERDGTNTVIAIHFTVLIHDTATAETKSFGYRIQNSEFTSLPPATSPALRRAAIIQIIKRETKIVFDAWVAERNARIASTVVRDPTTDLGVSAITNTDTTNPTP